MRTSHVLNQQADRSHHGRDGEDRASEWCVVCGVYGGKTVGVSGVSPCVCVCVGGGWKIAIVIAVV